MTCILKVQLLEMVNQYKFIICIRLVWSFESNQYLLSTAHQGRYLQYKMAYIENVDFLLLGIFIEF